MEKIVDVVKAGMGFPACHFDDSHIKMMLRKGFDFEDARDYCLMGCVEPQKIRAHLPVDLHWLHPVAYRYRVRAQPRADGAVR